MHSDDRIKVMRKSSKAKSKFKESNQTEKQDRNETLRATTMRDETFGTIALKVMMMFKLLSYKLCPTPCFFQVQIRNTQHSIR